MTAQDEPPNWFVVVSRGAAYSRMCPYRDEENARWLYCIGLKFKTVERTLTPAADIIGHMAPRSSYECWDNWPRDKQVEMALELI